MNKCEECGRVFRDEEYSRWREPAGWENCGCPSCGSENCFDVYPCKICGECEEMLEGETYCEACKKEVMDALSEFISGAFTDEQKQLLRELDEVKGLSEWCDFLKEC